MSQNDRVLAALRRGPVNPVDFAEIPTLDGGKPILRLAARIGVLRDRGHEIDSVKRSNGTVTYTLVKDAEQGSGTTAVEPPVVASPTAALLGAPARGAGDTPLSPAPTLFDEIGMAA